jgi:hypothetical protein
LAVAYPEEHSLSSPNTITQANLSQSEQNLSVSYGYEYVLAADDLISRLSNLALVS